MRSRIHEWAGLAAALTLAVGCGGGEGAGGGAIPAGPAAGQSPGKGFDSPGGRAESSGPGFDKPAEHAENPGGGWGFPGQNPDHGGAGGGPGNGDGGPNQPGQGGAGGSGGAPGGEGDMVSLCKTACERGTEACGTAASCNDGCAIFAHLKGHPCEASAKAALQCGSSASNFTCEDGEYEPVGCDQQSAAFEACVEQHSGG